MAAKGGKTSPRNIAAREKQAHALRLRRAGATYDEIAKTVGYANPSVANRAVRIALQQIPKEDAEAVLRLEVARYDELFKTMWLRAVTLTQRDPKNPKSDKQVPLYKTPAQAMAVQGAAIDRLLRISDQRARLLGLNAPQQHVILAVEEGLQKVLSVVRKYLTAEQFQALAGELIGEGSQDGVGEDQAGEAGGDGSGSTPGPVH